MGVRMRTALSQSSKARRIKKDLSQLSATRHRSIGEECNCCKERIHKHGFEALVIQLQCGMTETAYNGYNSTISEVRALPP